MYSTLILLSAVKFCVDLATRDLNIIFNNFDLSVHKIVRLEQIYINYYPYLLKTVSYCDSFILQIKINSFKLYFILIFYLFSIVNQLEKVQMNKQLSPIMVAKVDQSLRCIKQKLSMLNYENLQPPFILNSLSQLRELHLGKIINTNFLISKNQPISGSGYQSYLKYIEQNIEVPTYDMYRQQLIKPYITKLKKSRNQFEALKIKEVNNQEKFIMDKQADLPLHWIAQWLIQTQITQDLLYQIQLYLRIKVPHLTSKLKSKANSHLQRQSWTQSIIEKIKNMLSKTLKTSEKIVQSNIFTGIVTGALFFTIWIHNNTPIAFEQKLNVKCFAPVGILAILPSIFSCIYTTIDATIIENNFNKWQETLATLIVNIKNFNIYLEIIVKNCLKCQTQAQFIKDRTNIEKIILNLTKNVDFVAQFDKEKCQEIRERTQAYYQQYKEIRKGQWTLVTRQIDQPISNQSQQSNNQIYQELIPETEIPKVLINHLPKQDSSKSDPIQ